MQGKAGKTYKKGRAHHADGYCGLAGGETAETSYSNAGLHDIVIKG